MPGSAAALAASRHHPDASAARDRFVLERRPPRPSVDPWVPQGAHVEEERGPDGTPRAVLTVFLTGRECPFRCVMCDLWQFTTTTDTPRGALPAQIDAARAGAGPAGTAAEHVKLYNASSFFDPRAVPEEDYGPIARRLAPFREVVVESHPALVGARVSRFQEALGRAAGAAGPAPRLQVAMGLETAHPVALERLHKAMTLDQFARAARGLRARDVSLRAFVLVHPPFVAPDKQDQWLARSVDFAFECGAAVVSLIPTRGGNGALEALAAAGDFQPPRLSDLERALDLALAVAGGRGRVFADLWDLARFAGCAACRAPRTERLRRANLDQRPGPALPCPSCGGVGQP
jgi:radical SAM enzyme (TIGR01210 family)